MKKLIIFILVIAISISVSAQWTPLNSGATTSLRDIFFKDASTGFCVGGGDVYGYPIAGEKSTILKTVDGGSHWEMVFEDTTMGLSCIAANGNTISAFGRNTNYSFELRSSDNGMTWSIDTIDFFPMAFTQSIKYLENELYVLTENGELKKMSSNLWITLTDSQFRGAIFNVDTQGIFMAQGPPHYLYYSTNDGLTWSSIAVSTPHPLSPSPYSGALLQVFGDSIIMTTTYSNMVAYSYDGGASWGDYLLGDINVRLIISPQAIMGIVGAGKVVVRSIDGGQTFVNQDTMYREINKFFFVNENLGFLCGNNGMIYKTTNGGGLPTGIQETNPLKKKLKIAPNPAKNTLRLQYDNLNIQSLQLTDLSGRIIKTFPAENKILDISDIAAGIYFLQVKAKEGTVAEKIEIR